MIAGVIYDTIYNSWAIVELIFTNIITLIVVSMHIIDFKLS